MQNNVMFKTNQSTEYQMTMNFRMNKKRIF